MADATGALFNGSTKHEKWSGSRNHGNLISKMKETEIWNWQPLKIISKNVHLIKVFSRSFFLHSSVRSAKKGNTNISDCVIDNDENEMLSQKCVERDSHSSKWSAVPHLSTCTTCTNCSIVLILHMFYTPIISIWLKFVFHQKKNLHMFQTQSTSDHFDLTENWCFAEPFFLVKYLFLESWLPSCFTLGDTWEWQEGIVKSLWWPWWHFFWQARVTCASAPLFNDLLLARYCSNSGFPGWVCYSLCGASDNRDSQGLKTVTKIVEF